MKGEGENGKRKTETEKGEGGRGKGKGDMEKEKEKKTKRLRNNTDLQHMEQCGLSGVIETQEEQLRMLIHKPERCENIVNCA